MRTRDFIGRRHGEKGSKKGVKEVVRKERQAKGLPGRIRKKPKAMNEKKWEERLPRNLQRINQVKEVEKAKKEGKPINPKFQKKKPEKAPPNLIKEALEKLQSEEPDGKLKKKDLRAIKQARSELREKERKEKTEKKAAQAPGTAPGPTPESEVEALPRLPGRPTHNLAGGPKLVDMSAPPARSDDEGRKATAKEFSDFKDKVKFGEVVQAPPTITAAPKNDSSLIRGKKKSVPLAARGSKAKVPQDKRSFEEYQKSVLKAYEDHKARRAKQLKEEAKGKKKKEDKLQIMEYKALQADEFG